MKTRQCTRSVYIYDLSSIFQNTVLCCCFCFSVVFQPQPKLVVSIFFVLNQYFTSEPSTVTTKLSSVSLLYVTALIGSQFFSAKPYMEIICYMVGIYIMVDVFRISAFYYYLHRLSFNFLMRRRTCVPASIILSLSFSLCNMWVLLKEWGKWGSMRWV